MRKINFIMFFVFFVSCMPSTKGQNIAEGKSYSFSVKPNYGLTDGADYTDLTDGERKSGIRFWQRKSTVGWQNKQEVRVDLDLQELYSIDGFRINTARGQGAGVMFPLSCHVFTSVDNKMFEYQGDLMLTGDYSSGDYKVDSFYLTNLKSKGQYVTFIFTANGKYIFLDEIEVYGKKTHNAKTNSNQLVKKSDMDAFIRRALNESVAERSERRHIESAKNYLGDFKSGVEGDINETIKSTQKKVLPDDIIFTPINSIEALNNFSLDAVVEYQNKLDKPNFLYKKNGLYYFSIINNKSKQVSIAFKGTKGLDYTVYEILPVVSQNKVNIKDALKPVNNNLINIETGENKYFVIQTCQQGVGDGKVQVLSQAMNDLIGELIINHNTIQPTGSMEKLEVNLWTYLDRPVLKDNIEFVVNDLENAGVDVIVVNSVFIDGYGTKDFAKLKKYLRNFRNLQDKKVLLFYNFQSKPQNKFNGKTFLDSEWKNNFKQWYLLMQRELSDIGVRRDEIYFYPYDEIKPNEVANFVELVKWGKSVIPYFKTFVTINTEKSYEAGKFADIIQVFKPHLNNIEKIGAKDIWVYDVINQSRDRDPYKYYRLMSWYAYYYNLKGVGFWNYSNLTSKNDAYYNRVVNGNKEYSVIYLDENDDVMFSLRWLCFQEGLSDYQLLKKYEGLIGKDRVKRIVENVINDHNNSEAANKALRNLADSL